jgi:hypothetical protein
MAVFLLPHFMNTYFSSFKRTSQVKITTQKVNLSTTFKIRNFSQTTKMSQSNTMAFHQIAITENSQCVCPIYSISVFTIHGPQWIPKLIFIVGTGILSWDQMSHLILFSTGEWLYVVCICFYKYYFNVNVCSLLYPNSLQSTWLHCPLHPGWTHWNSAASLLLFLITSIWRASWFTRGTLGDGVSWRVGGVGGALSKQTRHIHPQLIHCFANHYVASSGRFHLNERQQQKLQKHKGNST